MRTLRRFLLLTALAALAGLLPALNASASTQRTAGGGPITMAATSITTTSAVLNGRYQFTGNTLAHFQYGLTTSYGSFVVAAGPVTPNTVDSVLITGLTPNTTYNFRYVQGSATVGFGNPGSNLTFTTLSDGSTTAAPRDESADLAIAKSQSADTVTAGGSVTFTLTITHRAGARAFDVGLTDRMPAGLAVTSVTTTKGSCTTEVLCTIGEMGAGETVTVRITATANVVGTIVNTATVGAANPDPNVALNNSARVVLNVRPQVSTRTLSLTSTTRVAGGGSATDAGREYAAAIKGALASAQAACVSDVTLVVSQGATADALAQIGTVTTNATGAIDGRAFIPGTGRFFQVSVAATEGATVACSAASARFEIAPPSITRTITAEAERGTAFNTIDTVTISGRLTASSPFCSRFIQLNWEMLNAPRNFQRPADVPRTKADGTFSFQLTNPGARVTVIAPADTRGANLCAAARITVDMPPQPVRRVLSVKTSRTDAAGTSAEWQVNGTVEAQVASCAAGSTAVVERRDSADDDWRRTRIVSDPADGRGRLSLTIPDDDGQFRIVLRRSVAGLFECSETPVGVKAPQRSVAIEIAATAERVVGRPGTIRIAGQLASPGQKTLAVTECNPRLVAVFNRDGSGAEWEFAGWLSTVDDKGAFRGEIRTTPAAQWRVAASADTNGIYECREAAAPLDVPAEPDDRSIRFTVGASLRIEGTLSADTAQCATGIDLEVRNIGIGPATIRTGTAVRAGSRWSAPFSYQPASFGGTNAWQVSVERATVRGADCLAASYDVNQVVLTSNLNYDGQVEISGTVRSVNPACAAGVAVQALRPDGSGFAPVAADVTGSDGTYGVTFRDPSIGYRANSWRMVTPASGQAGIDCAEGEQAFTLFRPQPSPPPPPPPPVQLTLTRDEVRTITPDTVRILYTVKATPASGAADCIKGQRVFLGRDGGQIARSTNIKLGDGGIGTAQVDVDLARNATQVGAYLAPTGPRAARCIVATAPNSPPGTPAPDTVLIPGFGQPATSLVTVFVTDTEHTEGRVTIKGRVYAQNQSCREGVPLTIGRVSRAGASGSSASGRDGFFEMVLSTDKGGYGPSVDWQVSTSPIEVGRVSCAAASSFFKVPVETAADDSPPGQSEMQLTANFDGRNARFGLPTSTGTIQVSLYNQVAPARDLCRAQGTVRVQGEDTSGGKTRLYDLATVKVGSGQFTAVPVTFVAGTRSAVVSVSYTPYGQEKCKPSKAVTVSLLPPDPPAEPACIDEVDGISGYCRAEQLVRQQCEGGITGGYVMQWRVNFESPYEWRGFCSGKKDDGLFQSFGRLVPLS